ncbi:MAG: c-type cytochrome domain-containing protein, partial [Planctomycetota bacterium]
MRRSSFVLVALSLLGAAGAQDPAADVARLQQLLEELKKASPAAWNARAEALEQAAKAADQKAAELRAQAGKPVEQAAAAEAESKRLRDDIARLRQLQQALRELTTPGGTGDGPQKEPARAVVPKPEVAKPEAPKVEAAKDEPAPAAAPPGSTPATAASGPTTLVDWTAVEPLLQDRCSACHEPSDKKGGLDVTTFAAVRAGGGSGRTLVPGEPDQSRLWLLVAQQERPFMPRGEEPLKAEQVALLRTWIEQGAAETQAAARAFVAGRLAAASAAGESEGPAVLAPVPHELPPIEPAWPARPGALKSLARSPGAALLALPGLRQVLLFDTGMKLLGALPVDAKVVDQLAFAN